MTGSTLVGMAEIKVIQETGSLVCLGLGSCVGICALDPVAKVGGMVHVMLPEAFNGEAGDKPGKFADTALPALIAQMEAAGARKSRLVLAVSGGAQVFKSSTGAAPKLDVGERNGAAVREAIRKHGLRCKAEDLGGNQGRTVTFKLDTGDIIVKTLSVGEKNLTNLRAA
jgi:chemotaxis protein CheD